MNVYHSLQPSADVNLTGAIPRFPIRLHGKYMDKLSEIGCMLGYITEIYVEVSRDGLGL